MELLGYDAFGELRLSEFLPPERLWEQDNWEFMGCVWLGEVCGFTGFLRLMERPRVVRAICLHFSEIRDTVAKSILTRIGLTLAPGMPPEEVFSILGNPKETVRFTADRVSHQFVTACHPRYDVDCGFYEPQGLVVVNILRPDYKKWRVASG